MPDLRVVWQSRGLKRGTLRLECLLVVCRRVMLPLLLQRLRLRPFALRRLMSLLLLILLGLQRLPGFLLLLVLLPVLLSPLLLWLSSLPLLGSLDRFKLHGIWSLLLLMLALLRWCMLRWRNGPRACCRSCIRLRLRRSASPVPDRCRNGAGGAGLQPSRSGSAAAQRGAPAVGGGARRFRGSCRNASPGHTAIVG